MERLHAGWLVKSPPEKRTIGPWRLFKSKWRERYFVLYAPPSSQTIPGCCSAVLCYYDNENLLKEYGRVDLSQCEEILTQLESDEHRNIFALRTVSKDSERTYYLAAGSEDEMNQWARCLCCVLRLSGGDGINLPSGFENLSPSYGESILGLGRGSILTQRSGEQRRIANVPETISKSASALNIRLAEASPPAPSQSASNSTAPAAAAAAPKSGNGRTGGRRQSILNMVVKPASSLRRPSFLAVDLSSVAAPKFQTVSRTTGLHLMAAANQSLLNNNSNNNNSTSVFGAQQTFSAATLGRPAPRLTVLPPTPAVSYAAPFKGPDFFGEHFGNSAAAATPGVGGLQCPPLLPSRPGAQSRDTSAAPAPAPPPPQVHQHRRSSSDDWRWERDSAAFSRNDEGLIDEDTDEGSFEPDYVHPHPVYDNEASAGNDEDQEELEALEEDREDHYSYPPFHYNLSSPPTTSTDDPPRRTSPSLLTGEEEDEEEDEGEPCDDSYDYLPCHGSSSRAPSERMSVARSSTHTNASDQGEAIYDVLPVRNYGSEAEAAAAAAGSVQRMSGIEPSSTTPADQGIIYQNDVFRSRSSEMDPDATFLPPLPEKKGGREEKGSGPLLPASPRPDGGASSGSGPGFYINNVDAMTTTQAAKNERNSQCIVADNDEVYLPMNGGGGGGPGDDSVYTPMCSPEAEQRLSSGEASAAARNSRDGHDGSGETSTTPLHDSQRSGNATDDQTPRPGSLVPIRFTANSRSFKRKVPRRQSLDKRAECSTNSSEQNENLEPFPAASSAPPLPPKKSAAARNSNYVHYASLNLDDVVEKLPSSSPPPSSPGGPGGGLHATDTLYRQIDPEKTKALCELKKQMDDNRQRNLAKLAPEH